MKNHKEIEQLTDDWFKIKHGKIGGTLAHGLYVNSDTLFFDLLGQNCEDYVPNEDDYISQAMERGNFLEPMARQYLSKYVGVEFIETGWLQSEENELMGVSPDGITECETMGCEIKALGHKEHYKLLVNREIDKIKYAQIIQNFAVNPKLVKFWFIAYRPEAPKHFIEVFDLDTVLDMGLKIKVEIPQTGVKGQPIASKWETSPDLRTIRDWVKYSMEEADKLLIRINEMKLTLEF